MDNVHATIEANNQKFMNALYHLNCSGREKPLMWLKPCCSNQEGMLRGKDEAKPR